MASESRLTKRQLKKLAKEQAGIVKKDPNNLVARLKLAGALKDLGKAKDAVAHYQEVAEAYANTGKLVQAISVYKGILEIQPGDETTESALTELSAQRAVDIKSKSMPQLHQQENGRWVMPAEDEVSEEEGTDPGDVAGKATPTSQSVLRLPAPEKADGPRSRRRRSRPMLPVDVLPEMSSDLDLDETVEAVDGAGVPSRGDGFQPSLPSMRHHESAGEPAPSRPDKHIPPERVVLPPETRLAPPPLPARGPPPPVVAVGNEVEVLSVGKDVAAPSELHEETTAEHADPLAAAGSAAFRESDLELTVDVPSSPAGDDSFLDGEQEETTSPGPSSYDETIRKSAMSIDVSAIMPNPAESKKAVPRRTLVGMPMPEHPDLPEAPDVDVPPPAERPTAQGRSPLPAVTGAPNRPPQTSQEATSDRERADATRRADLPPSMTPPPQSRPQKPDLPPSMACASAPEPFTANLEEQGDVEIESVFDEDEAAFWAEFGNEDAGRGPDALSQPPPTPVTSVPFPGSAAAAQARQSMATPIPAAEGSAPPTSTAEPHGRPSTQGGRRKSSKMTIPMGAAALQATDAISATPTSPVDEVRLEEIQLFRDLSETSREMLKSRLIRRTEKTGAIIVREGDPGNALFVVSSGKVTVSKEDRQGGKIDLATLGPGAFFGEFALLSDRKRHATVTVSEDGVFFEISRKVIANLTKSDPAFGNTLRQFYRRRLLGTLVQSAPFFEPLSEEERESLMGRLRFRRIPENSKIITEGEPGGGFFLILIGEVKVTKTQPDGSERVLSSLTDGTYFGEMSLLKGGNAVASVTTVTPTEIVQLAAAEFYRILSKYPQIWEEVNRVAKRRELANLQILSGRSPSAKHGNGSVVL
ncbi:MAG: cyclic nucleotide-binding domain-containing protein [bacterium]